MSNENLAGGQQMKLVVSCVHVYDKSKNYLCKNLGDKEGGGDLLEGEYYLVLMVLGHKIV